ncbi:hypothetical protein U1Q18_027452 [Sarracenia purpurea var. burkii]
MRQGWANRARWASIDDEQREPTAQRQAAEVLRRKGREQRDQVEQRRAVSEPGLNRESDPEAEVFGEGGSNVGNDWA